MASIKKVSPESVGLDSNVLPNIGNYLKAEIT